MTRTVVLRDWDAIATKLPAPPSSRLQYTPRHSGRPCRYPNEIRRYRISHRWTQEEVATRMGCTRDTVSKWECGRSFPQGPTILRLARVLDTFVEALYYDHITVERFFELPPWEPVRRVVPLSAPLVLPAGATVVADEPRDFGEWHRQLLTTQLLDDTIRAKHQDRHHEPMWVPIRCGGRAEPLVVPYIQWDNAPSLPKSLLMTAWWMRRYTLAKGKQPPMSTTRLAYENYFTLFARHERALQRDRHIHSTSVVP